MQIIKNRLREAGALGSVRELDFRSDLDDEFHKKLLDCAVKCEKSCKKIDLSQHDFAKIREELRSIIDLQSKYTIIWPYNRECFVACGDFIIDSIDDLWYPSTDDVFYQTKMTT